MREDVALAVCAAVADEALQNGKIGYVLTNKNWAIYQTADGSFVSALTPAEFDALNRPGADELHRAALAGNGLLSAVAGGWIAAKTAASLETSPP